MSNNPSDVANEALDAAGSQTIIADLEEGTRVSKVVLRKYSQCLRQLQRAVHWDTFRQMAPLELLGDATGSTPGAGTQVIPPWVYEYSYPTNCMKARFLPRNYLNPGAPPGNISIPNTPLTTGGAGSPPYGYGMRLIPGRFLISMDTNYAIDPNTDWMETQGVSPTGRVVILTNVKSAQLVYTAFMPYPSMWDSQFRAAFVAYLAAEIAMGISDDKKFGLEMRDRNFKIASEKVQQARVTNGNEAGFPQTIDHMPDWMNNRWRGGGGNFGGMGGGAPWGEGGCGWDGTGFNSYGFDTSVF